MHLLSYRTARDLLSIATACLLALLVTESAAAQAVEYQIGDLTIGLGGRAGVGYVATGNTNFGAGFDVGFDGVISDDDRDVDYAEGFLQPRIDLSYETGDYGAFYGAATVIGAVTRSNGDPGGFTFDNPEDVDLGHLYAGWKSGQLFSELGEDALDVSAGRQDFHIGDGFIIWDGNFDTAGDATYWLAPRTAFDNTGIIKFNTGPLHADAFYLKGDQDQEHSELSAETWNTPSRA